MTKTTCATRAAWVALALLAMTAFAGTARAEDNPWAEGTNWLTMRAGYAKSTVEGSGGGGAGYAFGYSRMIRPLKIYKWSLFRHSSLGVYAQHDVVGRFGRATEIMAPVSLELVRHYGWKTAFKPYLGIGAGAFYRKLYRTGADDRNVNLGGYLTMGGLTAVADHRVVGFDLRIARVNTELDTPNPVFGPGKSKATVWSAKVGYSITY